jgi:hypothetical protein
MIQKSWIVPVVSVHGNAEFEQSDVEVQSAFLS